MPDDALTFYKLHADVDVEHGLIRKEILKKYADTKELQEACINAQLMKNNMRRVMADCIYMAYVVQGCQARRHSTAPTAAAKFLSELSRIMTCAFLSPSRLRYSGLAAESQRAPRRLRIAYSSISGAMLPLWVAKDKGLFDKHGVEVEVTYIRGVAIEALLAGEVQFVRASPPAVVRSTLRGADLAIIANTINVAVFSLMTKPEIKRPEDLKGKKIGVTNLGRLSRPRSELAAGAMGPPAQQGRDRPRYSRRHAGTVGFGRKGFVDGGMISAPSNLRGHQNGTARVGRRRRLWDSLRQLARSARAGPS